MKALIDLRAEGKFINQNYTWLIRMNNIWLKEPIPVLNVDGTWNKWGTITHYTELNTTISNCTWKQHVYITRLGKQKMIFGFTWLNKWNPDINWQTGKIKWWQPEGHEECICLSNGVCVNKPSEETTWTKPPASEPSCTNYTEYQKATIEEESDTEEWMDSSDEPSVNRPFSNDLDNFNDITIQYIGTDASPAELHMELYINTTLKPLDALFSNIGHKTHQLQKKKYLQNTMNIWTSSKKKWNDSLAQDYGTMPLKQNPDLNPKFSNCITLHWRNMNNRNYSSRKISRRDIFDCQDHQWLPLSSLSTRKMGNYDWHRITDISINGQSRMPICYHSSQKS